jgi:hypothetical protein
MSETYDEMRNRFGFHPANEITAPKHDSVRQEVLYTACLFADTLPDSREKSLALTALQEAAMWANAAIAIHLAPLKGDSDA